MTDEKFTDVFNCTPVAGDALTSNQSLLQYLRVCAELADTPGKRADLAYVRTDMLRKVIDEMERLTYSLNQRDEQIDGYERQLGIIDADASRTIGTEIERLRSQVRHLVKALNEAREDIRRGECNPELEDYVLPVGLPNETPAPASNMRPVCGLCGWLHGDTEACPPLREQPASHERAEMLRELRDRASNYPGQNHGADHVSAWALAEIERLERDRHEDHERNSDIAAGLAQEIEHVRADLESEQEQYADLLKRWGAVVDERDALRADVAKLRIGDFAAVERYIVIDREAYNTHVAQQEADRREVLRLRAELLEAVPLLRQGGPSEIAGLADRLETLAGGRRAVETEQRQVDPYVHGLAQAGIRAERDRRIIERHMRWRERAIGFLRDALKMSAERGDEWRELEEFLERSESHMVESSSETEPPRKLTLKDFGYAPGDYVIKCSDCGKERWDCDKRATRCKACAERALAASSPKETTQPRCGICGETGTHGPACAYAGSPVGQ